MMQVYAPRATPPLQCDIVAIAGMQDTLVSASRVEGWRRLCGGTFTCSMLPGGHFFVHDADGVPTVLRALMALGNEQATPH